MSGRLTLLAGSGGLVDEVAAVALAAGLRVQVLSFVPREPLPGVRFRNASLSRPLRVLLAVRMFRSDQIVLAGAISLNDRTRVGLARFMGGRRDQRAAAPTGDTAMSGLAKTLRRLTGAEVVGVQAIAPQLLARDGHIGGPSSPADPAFAMETARAIGRLDIGQAAVTSGRRVIAVEDVGGTDDLIARVGVLRARGVAGDGGVPLVLAKARKPGQPDFVDLPAIGPQTVRGAAEAGIGVIAVEAGQALIIERSEWSRKPSDWGSRSLGSACREHGHAAVHCRREPSGDRLAARLVRDLRKRVELNLSGIGGAALVAEGLSPLFPMSELSVMGAVDVIRALPRLLARVRDTADAILRTKPNLVVLVDSQEFSARVARRLRRHGHTGPIVLYVAPAVWAHGAKRAARLKGVVDEILAVLPFEPAVLQALGGPPTTYVGHPAADGVLPNVEPGVERDSVLLLPGSRRGELRRHLAGFRDAVKRLAERRPELRFTILSLPHLVDEVRASTSGWGVETAISSGAAERDAWLARAKMAICKSGTATLELALAEVPQVIVYALDPIQGIVYGRKGRPPVGLPNIILGERTVPELVSRELDGRVMADAALALLDDEDAMERQRLAFGRLRQLLSEGEPLSPRQSAAERVLAHLGR